MGSTPDILDTSSYDDSEANEVVAREMKWRRSLASRCACLLAETVIWLYMCVFLRYLQQ